MQLRSCPDLYKNQTWDTFHAQITNDFGMITCVGQPAASYKADMTDSATNPPVFLVLTSFRVLF